MRIDNNGYVGIGTTGPDRKLDILDNTNPQLRLTHTDGSNGTDLQSTSNSLLEISPVGASTANSLRVNSNDVTCRMYMKGSSGPSLHMGIHSGRIYKHFSGMMVMEVLNLELIIQKECVLQMEVMLV